MTDSQCPLLDTFGCIYVKLANSNPNFRNLPKVLESLPTSLPNDASTAVQLINNYIGIELTRYTTILVAVVLFFMLISFFFVLLIFYLFKNISLYTFLVFLLILFVITILGILAWSGLSRSILGISPLPSGQTISSQLTNLYNQADISTLINTLPSLNTLVSSTLECTCPNTFPKQNNC